MRTLVIAVIGLALASAFVFCSSYLSKSKRSGATAFIAVWFLFCVVDYSNGVKAGFGPLEELGIHIVLFVLPTIGAWVAARYLP